MKRQNLANAVGFTVLTAVLAPVALAVILHGNHYATHRGADLAVIWIAVAYFGLCLFALWMRVDNDLGPVGQTVRTAIFALFIGAAGLAVGEWQMFDLGKQPHVTNGSYFMWSVLCGFVILAASGAIFRGIKLLDGRYDPAVQRTAGVVNTSS